VNHNFIPGVIADANCARKRIRDIEAAVTGEVPLFCAPGLHGIVVRPSAMLPGEGFMSNPTDRLAVPRSLA